MITLVLQSFGKEAEYKRAIFTILSYYAHTTLPVQERRVLLFTDKPDYFEFYLKDISISYVLLTPGKIKEMRGRIDFLHRMKIAVIEEAFSIEDGYLLYADSDTFFIKDPLSLAEQLTPDKSFMHVLEYQFESLRNFKLPAGKTFSAFIDLIEAKTFYGADGREIIVYPKDVSWNAGVMFFHPSHVHIIRDVYALTDQFYTETLNHASEQYAFSILLQRNTEIKACDEVIYHYWYQVKKQIVDEFLDKQLTKNWLGLSLQEKLKEVRDWTMALPRHFEKHVWMTRDHAIQAFNDNKFSEGYRWAAKAFLQSPFDSRSFLKNSFYHLKRHLTHK